MSDEVHFDEVDCETFKAAFEGAARAVRERPPLTQAERDAGWSEDPISGLRRNEVTDEWDDSFFVLGSLVRAQYRPS
jgi:hypothetical protein